MNRRHALLARKRPLSRAADDDELLSQKPPSRARSVSLPENRAAGWNAPQVAALQRRAGNRATVRALGRNQTQSAVSFLPASVARDMAIMRWPLQRIRKNTVHRITVPRTATADADWQRVPDDHLARVQAAVRIINSKVTSRQLVNYFRDHAPGGTVNTLQQVANRAKVWELRTAGRMGLSEEGGDDMAYDTDVYRIGRWQVAATLLHEMGHLARFPTEAECENTMDAANTYAPLIRSVRPRRAAPGDTVTISGISFGPSQESADRVTLNGADVGRALIWRWRHAGQGQIQFRVPQGATSGPLVVENNRVQSNAVQLTIVPVAEEAGAAGAAPAPGPALPAPEAAD